MNELTLTWNAGKSLKGHYRSKLFIVTFTTNRFVTAAGPLFSLLERLYTSLTLPPIQILRNNIEHELQAFLSQINTQNPETEELEALAYYLICATIGELLGKSYLRLEKTSAEFKAFTPISALNDLGPEERVFIIIDYIKCRPNQYLDLIELVYYCLIAGFEGKYTGKQDNRIIIDNLIEELYQIIDKHRAHKTYKLFNNNISTQTIQSHNHTKILISIILTIGLIATSILCSYSLIEHKINAIRIYQEQQLVLSQKIAQ